MLKNISVGITVIIIEWNIIINTERNKVKISKDEKEN